MKSFLLIAILLISNSFICQDLHLEYTNGGYLFGNEGEVEKVEIIKVIPNRKKFTIEFVQIKRSYFKNSKTNLNDGIKIDTLIKKSSKVKSKIIKNIINDLKISANNFDFETIDSNLERNLTKNEIIKIAKNNDILYYLTDEDGEKIDEYGRKIINDLKKKKGFKIYVEGIKPNIENFLITVDRWNFLLIKANNNNFKLDFFNVLGQPISTDDKQFVNLNINSSLLKILPKNSILRESLEFESLYNDYVIWYLKNKPL